MNDTKRKELRELAASSRFSKTWDLLSSKQESDVMNGVRGIKRMLENRNFSFDDVLQSLLHGDHSPQVSSASGRSRSNSAYGGMHNDPFSPRPHPTRKEPPPAPVEGLNKHAMDLLARTTFSSEGLPVIGGKAIPSAVDGVPAIIAREDTPLGHIILFCVISQGSCYGPIASMSDKTNREILIHDQALNRIRVHITGPYSHAPVPVANRIFLGAGDYA